MRIIYSYDGAEKITDLQRDIVLIGRPTDIEKPDLDFSHDIVVSRSHALLWVRDGLFWIKDLDSKSGTRVNGEEIKGKGKRQVLPGDSIEIGNTTLQLDFSTAELPD